MATTPIELLRAADTARVLDYLRAVRDPLAGFVVRLPRNRVDHTARRLDRADVEGFVVAALDIAGVTPAGVLDFDPDLHRHPPVEVSRTRTNPAHAARVELLRAAERAEVLRLGVVDGIPDAQYVVTPVGVRRARARVLPPRWVRGYVAACADLHGRTVAGLEGAAVAA